MGYLDLALHFMTPMLFLPARLRSGIWGSHAPIDSAF